MPNQPLPPNAANAASAILKFLEKSESEFIEERNARKRLEAAMAAPRASADKKGDTDNENL